MAQKTPLPAKTVMYADRWNGTWFIELEDFRQQQSYQDLADNSNLDSYESKFNKLVGTNKPLEEKIHQSSFKKRSFIIGNMLILGFPPISMFLCV
jgi:hypothetical protein